MNEEFKELYNYLKSNGITDLDENAFYQAYSSPEASKEVFDYVKSQDMTDLDESSFYSSYFGDLMDMRKNVLNKSLRNVFANQEIQRTTTF